MPRRRACRHDAASGDPWRGTFAASPGRATTDVANIALALLALPLVCMIVAGLCGGFTPSRRILVAPALPAAVVLVPVLALAAR